MWSGLGADKEDDSSSEDEQEKVRAVDLSETTNHTASEASARPPAAASLSSSSSLSPSLCIPIAACAKTKCKCTFTGGRYVGTETGDTWVQLEKTFPIIKSDDEGKSEKEAVDDAIDAARRYIVEQPPRKWAELNAETKKSKENFGTTGILEVKFACRWRDLADCNCKLKICYVNGSKKVTIKWWVRGSAHGMPADTTGAFSTLEKHKLFYHSRWEKSDGLPLQMIESIEDIIKHYPNLGLNKLEEHLMAAENEDGTKTWDLSPQQWAIYQSKINSRRKTVQKELKQRDGHILEDNMKDIQAIGAENTLEKRVDRGEINSVHDLWCAGMDIKYDDTPPPTDPNELKDWKGPRHICRLFFTSVRMATYVPTIASRGDILSRIVLAADTTYKLFFVGKFRVLIVFVYDATGNAKPIGVLVTCTEDAGDYCFATTTARNASEYVCSVKAEDLPGDINELPDGMPSFPPCNRENPLTYFQNDSGKWTMQQDNTTYTFKTGKSRRHESIKAKEAREKITEQATYYPPLVQNADIAECFRWDIVGLNFHDISDGDDAIPNGIGGAVPSITDNHVECNVHMDRNLRKHISKGGSTAPVDKSDFSHIDDKEERSRAYAKARNAAKDHTRESLRENKYCCSRGLGNILFEDLQDRLCDGRFSGSSGSCKAFADDYLSPRYGRINSKGSHGVHRYADAMDENLGAYDEDDGTLLNDVVDLASLVFGMPDQTNSVETQNGQIKEDLDRERGTVPDRITWLLDYFMRYTMRDAIYGVSFLPVVYGNQRISSTKFAEELRLGMCFLGHEKPESFLNQVSLHKKHGSGCDCHITMFRGEDELELLEEMAREDDDPAKKKKNLRKNWYAKWKKVIGATEDELREMVHAGTIEYCADEDISECMFDTKDDVPADVETKHPNIWARARTAAINELYETERTFVRVSPINGNFDGIQCLEPFRAAQPKDKAVVYKWRCTCEFGLKYGFCGHIFFITHLHHDYVGADGYGGQQVPAAAQNFPNGLGEKRPRGRPPKLSMKKQRKNIG